MENEVFNKEAENLNFKSTDSFYKFLTNTNRPISLKDYQEAYKKMSIKGILKNTKKSKNYKNKILSQHCETKPFYEVKHVRTIKNIGDKKLKNIRHIFDRMGIINNGVVFHDFMQFFENNLKDKYKQTAKYLTLFLRGYDNEDNIQKGKVEGLFKPFLKSKLVGYSDVIFRYYKDGYKAITKAKGVMSILPKDKKGFVVYGGNK